MNERDQVLHFLALAKARVEGEDVVQTPDAREAIGYARERLEQAMDHVHAGDEMPIDVRLRPVRQALVAAVRPATSHQRHVNLQLLAATDAVTASMERLAQADDRHDTHANRTQAALATTDLTVDHLVEGVRRLSDAVTSMAADIGDVRTAAAAAADRDADELATVRSELDAVRSELGAVRAKQHLVFRIAREALAAQGMEVDQLTELSRELSTSYDELYQDLEDTFRGTREEVKAKLAVYLEDVAAVAGRGPVVDVGCGRGEWLELLRDEGIQAYGVDVNKVVVQRCVERGLDVRAADALVHLRELPEGSVRAITSFHVVEHLSLDTLVGLIDAALVALQPGGALIFETPNPTNVLVGASSFYLDPTHLKPLHPQFLQFLLEQRGFALVELRFLNSPPGPELAIGDLADGSDLDRNQSIVDRINWALSGPLDFGVVAAKAQASTRPLPATVPAPSP